MPDVEIDLFCTNCGSLIRREPYCPDCMVENEFLKYSPPDEVVAERKAAQAAGSAFSPQLQPSRTGATPDIPPGFIPTPIERQKTVKIDDLAAIDSGRTEAWNPARSRAVAEPSAVAVLLCQKGDNEKHLHELHHGEVSVGREDAVISLQSKRVSMLHAVIQVPKDAAATGELLVLDNNSTNGTFVNGEKIPPGVLHPLRDLDIVHFADVEFQLRVRSSRDTPPNQH
jgi:hypothetical protein